MPSFICTQAHRHNSSCLLSLVQNFTENQMPAFWQPAPLCQGKWWQNFLLENKRVALSQRSEPFQILAVKSHFLKHNLRQNIGLFTWTHDPLKQTDPRSGKGRQICKPAPRQSGHGVTASCPNTGRQTDGATRTSTQGTTSPAGCPWVLQVF